MSTVISSVVAWLFGSSTPTHGLSGRYPSRTAVDMDAERSPWTLAIVFGGCSHVQGDAEVRKMTVYYFPIGAETLTPITSASIQERGRHCEIRSSEDVSKIKKVLHDAAKLASQKFSDSAVRVKLLEASSEGDRLLAIVENEGEARFSDGTVTGPIFCTK